MWACGAAGSALPWHGRGRRFDPDQVHHQINYLQVPSFPAWCHLVSNFPNAFTGTALRSSTLPPKVTASSNGLIVFRQQSCFIGSLLPKPIVASPTIDTANRRQREQPQKPIQRVRVGCLEFDRATARTIPTHPKYSWNAAGPVQFSRIHFR